jgi:hypothetical protein
MPLQTLFLKSRIRQSLVIGTATLMLGSSMAVSFGFCPAAWAAGESDSAEATIDPAFALPLDNLEDIGYTLQRVQQQAIDLYVESTRKQRESKILLKSTSIPHEKFHPVSYYQPLRKAWLVFFIGTMEPLVQLLVNDVQNVEKHMDEVKITAGKKKQFDLVYAQWRETISGINRHLDACNDQVEEAQPSNIAVAVAARAINNEVNKAMQLRLRAYDLLVTAGPAARAPKSK